MPKPPQTYSDDFQYRVIFLRLGENITNYHALKYPDPFERPTTASDPDKIFADITSQTAQIRALASEHPSLEPLRQTLGCRLQVLLRVEVIQLIAAVARFDFATMRGEQNVDGYAHILSPLLNHDPMIGVLRARQVIAALLERRALVITDGNLHLNEVLRDWFSFGHPLCCPRLNDAALQAHLDSKVAKRNVEKKITPQPTALLAISSPQELYYRLTQMVHGQDEACKVLATRGWLHYKRAELLRKGQSVGANECLFFISQQSGVGKTYLAENYGKLCSLPFASFSSTDATAVGFVGLDLVEDSIKALIRAAGNPQEQSSIQKAQHGGIIFYDEWTKKRGFAGDGKDISSICCQMEVLRIMEGSKVILGNRRYDRDNHPQEVDTAGMMFIFGGYLEKFGAIVARLNRSKGSLGFSGNGDTKLRDAYLYDALVDYGMATEFLNRLTKIVMFRKLAAKDLIEIAIGSGGVVASYNHLLAYQGMSIRIEPQAIQCMAELCVESGMMARGLRMIVGALVEDAVFNAAKGEVAFGMNEVRQAIERIVSVDGVGQCEGPPGAALHTVHKNNISAHKDSGP